MVNAHRGEVSLEIAGKARTVVYDWDALARLKVALGPDYDEKIAQAGLTLDLEPLATALAIGLARDWPDVTAEKLKALSPPVIEVTDAIGTALTRAFYGEAEVPAQPRVDPLFRRVRRALSLRRRSGRPSARG